MNGGDGVRQDHQPQIHPVQGQHIQVQAHGGQIPGQPGIPMVLITQDGQRMMMPAVEWHRMQQLQQHPHASPAQGGMGIAGGGVGSQQQQQQQQQHIATNGIIGYASPQPAASVGMPVGTTPRMMINGNPTATVNGHGNPGGAPRPVTPTPIPVSGGRPITGYTIPGQQPPPPPQQHQAMPAYVPMGMAGQQMAMVPSGMQLQQSHPYQSGQLQGGQGFTVPGHAVQPTHQAFGYHPQQQQQQHVQNQLQQPQPAMYGHHPSPRFTQHPPTPTTTAGPHVPPPPPPPQQQQQQQPQPVRPTITIPNGNGNGNGSVDTLSDPPSASQPAGGQSSLSVNVQGGQPQPQLQSQTQNQTQAQNQNQNKTPVFKTPQPPHLLPPSWNKPTTAGAGQGMVGSSPSGGPYQHTLHLQQQQQQQQVQGTPTVPGLRTPSSAVSAPPPPGSAGPGPGTGGTMTPAGMGKITFLPPRALMGQQIQQPPPPNQYPGPQGSVNGHPAEQLQAGARVGLGVAAGSQQHVNGSPGSNGPASAAGQYPASSGGHAYLSPANGGPGAGPGPGPGQLGTPSAPIEVDGSVSGGAEGATLLAPFSGSGPGRVPTTPVYRVASTSTAGTPARGPAPMSAAPPTGTVGQSSLALLNMQGMSPAQTSHQHHQTQQIVYMPNGQSMVVMQQPPTSQDQRHQEAQLGMQMQEWRQGLATPMEEQAEMEWTPAPAVDVG